VNNRFSHLTVKHAIHVVLSLVHRRDALRHRLVTDPCYPETAGYYLLVRDRRDETGAQYSKPLACMDAEFNAYQALPAIDEAPLRLWFRPESSAYLDLTHTLVQLRQRGWVISNPYNPSTKRLLAGEVKKLSGNEAVVRTTEYWYLRWWSVTEQKYRYPYRETNQHPYILVNTSDGWRVDENIQPAPRSSTPHRPRK
jgi:hypothetical protein